MVIDQLKKWSKEETKQEKTCEPCGPWELHVCVRIMDAFTYMFTHVQHRVRLLASIPKVRAKRNYDYHRTKRLY